MNEVDNILGTKNNSERKNNYNQEKWKQIKDRQREWAYSTMEDMAQKIKIDSKLFKDYLDVQSRFEKHSVGNSLLILAKFPNATQFKERQAWKDLGIPIKKNAQPIIILEPVKSEKTGKTYYNPKEVFDISQTQAEGSETQKEYNIRELLGGFIHNCYAEIKVVDELPEERIGGAYYDKEENLLYVCRGMEKDTLISSLSYALAEIETREDADNSLKDFKNKCISYMLCKRYGIDVSNYDFSYMPLEISSQVNGKDVREEIDQIRVNFETINSRITESFEQSKEKKPKAKTQER